MTIEMPTGDLSYVSATMKKPQDINELHCKLRHVSEDTIQKNSKLLWLEIEKQVPELRRLCFGQVQAEKYEQGDPRKERDAWRASFHWHKLHQRKEFWEF